MATDFITNIERFFKQKSVLSNLIAINIIIFLVIKIVSVILLLFRIDAFAFLQLLELPASITSVLYRPWTLITYMFTHLDFFHILFNLLCLYWFGQIFLLFFKPKQLGGLYILGGIMGGLLFILSYNLFPYFNLLIKWSFLKGASASVMAIIFACAIYKKDFEVRLMFIGNVKLIYIASALFILDFIYIISDNSGGHIAHIGGALTGVWFALAYTKKVDITLYINKAIDAVVDFFTKKPQKTKVNTKHKRPETDYEYNKRKNDEKKEIDIILGKIKKSGYNSLSEKEKKTLFDAKK
ncbi:membrane associated rhomboid family serine protease [Dysgonomonadaceae bacterium PH5-43]|nr:membrane associated rhomboid family serine protease [Dysgonomonadaceae bacterium PH5-43]